MKKFVFSILPVFLFINTMTQEPAQRLTENDLQNFSRGSIVTLPDINSLYEGVKGTPYLTDKWEKGEILFTNGTKIEDIKIRYNIYKDELEFMNSTSGKSFIIDRQKVEGFNLIVQDKTLSFRNFNLKPEKNDDLSFFRILYNGSVTLLRKYKKEFRRADYRGGYATGKRYDEYIDGQDYYFVNYSGNIEKIRLGKKSVLSVLNNKEAEIKKYAAENSISFSDEEDIVKLLTFFDSLD